MRRAVEAAALVIWYRSRSLLPPDFGADGSCPVRSLPRSAARIYFIGADPIHWYSWLPFVRFIGTSRRCVCFSAARIGVPILRHPDSRRPHPHCNYPLQGTLISCITSLQFLHLKFSPFPFPNLISYHTPCSPQSWIRLYAVG